MQNPARLGRRWWSRMRNTSPQVVDLLLGATFVVVGLLSTADRFGSDPNDPYDHRTWVAFALIAGATVPYFVRRRAPLAVFTVSATSVAVLSMLGYAEGALPLVALVGAFTVGAHRPVREAGVAAAWMVALLLALFLNGSHGFDSGELASNSALFASAIFLGWNVQSRRLRLQALEQGHEEAARRAAADERLRIAQEIHDVVAHSLGVIAVQAGVGSHLLDRDPEEARRALDHISQTSRSSLAEIRRLLGVIRDRDAPAGYDPAPGVGDIPRLVDDVRHAGLRVELDAPADVDELPAGIGLVAYRIVQESLTNTIRHAEATRASVRLQANAGILSIEVVDDGRAPATATRKDGHGLIGMRERAALYGGTLEAGRLPAGGYRVRAELPYDREPAA